MEKQSVRFRKVHKKNTKKNTNRKHTNKKHTKKNLQKKGGSGSVDEDRLERATSLTAHNQGSCRSCWSFAIVKIIRYWQRIYGENPTNTEDLNYLLKECGDNIRLVNYKNELLTSWSQGPRNILRILNYLRDCFREMDPTPLQKVINIIDILVFGNKQHEIGIRTRMDKLEKYLGIENVGEMTIPPRIKIIREKVEAMLYTRVFPGSGSDWLDETDVYFAWHSSYKDFAIEARKFEQFKDEESTLKKINANLNKVQQNIRKQEAILQRGKNNELPKPDFDYATKYSPLLKESHIESLLDIEIPLYIQMLGDVSDSSGNSVFGGGHSVVLLRIEKYTIWDSDIVAPIDLIKLYIHNSHGDGDKEIILKYEEWSKYLGLEIIITFVFPKKIITNRIKKSISYDKEIQDTMEKIKIIKNKPREMAKLREMLVNMILHSIVKSNVDEELKNERLEHKLDKSWENLSPGEPLIIRMEDDEIREERNILRKELRKLFTQELLRKLSPGKTKKKFWFPENMFNKITQGNEELLSDEKKGDPQHFLDKVKELFDEWGVENRLDLTELDSSDIQQLIKVLDVENETTKDMKFLELPEDEFPELDE